MAKPRSKSFNFVLVLYWTYIFTANNNNIDALAINESSCSKGSSDEASYPNKILFKEDEDKCQVTKQDGRHIRLRWSLPEDLKDYKVDYLEIRVSIGVTMHCYRVPNDTTEFRYTEKNGYDENKNADYSIATVPVLKGLDWETEPISCKEEKRVREPPPQKPKRYKDSPETAYILTSIGLCVMLATVVAVVKFRCNSKKIIQRHNLVRSSDVVKVYISHCAQKEKEIHRLLNLCAHLNKYSNIEVCVDICNQIAIHNSNGMSSWVPENLANSDKVIMIVTPAYLQALNIISPSEDLFRKVSFEANFSRKCLYESCQRSCQITVVMDGVTKEEIPTEFQSRALVHYPKKFVQLDENWVTLVGLVLDIEPLQLCP